MGKPTSNQGLVGEDNSRAAEEVPRQTEATEQTSSAEQSGPAEQPRTEEGQTGGPILGPNIADAAPANAIGPVLSTGP